MKRTELKRSGPVKKKRGTSAAKEKAKATKLWGEYVHKRDEWCQRCTKSDGKLDAHHIMIREFSATRTDEDNGVLLCFRCHGVMHSDSMEGVTLYTRLLGIDGYDMLRKKAYDGVGGKYPASFWIDEAERLRKLIDELPT